MSAYDMDVMCYPRLARACLEKIRQQRKDGRPVERRIWTLCRRMVRSGLRLTRRRAPRGRPAALLSKALYEWTRGRKSRARKYFARARAEAESQGAFLMLGEVLLQEGRCLLDDGCLDSACRCLEQALVHFKVCKAGLYAVKAQALVERAASLKSCPP